MKEPRENIGAVHARTNARKSRTNSVQSSSPTTIALTRTAQKIVCTSQIKCQSKFFGCGWPRCLAFGHLGECGPWPSGFVLSRLL
jgi:hypothetical protein